VRKTATSAADHLLSAAPYGLMWYGNALAAPWPEDFDQMSDAEKNRVRMRQLLKGAVYGVSGYATTRLLFNNDYKKLNESMSAATRAPSEESILEKESEHRLMQAVRLAASA
jgi:hypothetical protein